MKMTYTHKMSDSRPTHCVLNIPIYVHVDHHSNEQRFVSRTNTASVNWIQSG